MVLEKVLFEGGFQKNFDINHILLDDLCEKWRLKEVFLSLISDVKLNPMDELLTISSIIGRKILEKKMMILSSMDVLPFTSFPMHSKYFSKWKVMKQQKGYFTMNLDQV